MLFIILEAKMSADMKLIKPERLKKGDTIALISPSAGLPFIFPHRLDNAIKFLKSEGYKIKEFSATRRNNGWESAPARERAKNVMEAFLDKEVKTIICTIGGEIANQTLEYLDFAKIRRNPKIFCGYSDISVLHYAIHTQAGLVTFYGPAAMTQFGEYPKPLDHTVKYFFRAVAVGEAIGIVKPSEKWTDELLDWSKKLDLERPRKLSRNKGYEWLRTGEAKGEIIGGCISSIIHLRGTKYWPDHQGKVLFLEIPEAQDFTKGEPLSCVDSYLADLRLSEVFKQISGMIVGRPFRYSKKDNQKLKEIILKRAEGYTFPIIYGVDIGHTDPQITVPLGVEVRISSKDNIFEILESAVSK